MTTEQQRRERVRNGSRRKRDLAAVGSNDAIEASSERWERAVAWARENLPDEHPEFAASAALNVKGSRRELTPETVRAHLVAIGNDHEALAARRRRLAARRADG